MDAVKNFAFATVATPPAGTGGTSLVFTTGQGARMPAVPFNLTLWDTGTSANPALAYHAGKCEVVRVTALSTDTATITRAQESTTAVDFTGLTCAAMAALTAKFAADVEPVQTPVSQAEAEAGAVTAIRSWTPQRVAQAIAALAAGGGEFPQDTAAEWFEDFLASYAGDQNGADILGLRRNDLNDLAVTATPSAAFTSSGRRGCLVARASVATNTRRCWNQFLNNAGNNAPWPLFGTTNFATDVRLESLSSAGEDHTFFLGLTGWSTSYNNIVQGIWFSYRHSENGGKWWAHIRNSGGTQTDLDTGITVAAGTWYRLKFIHTTGNVEFFVNGASVGSLTSGIPSSGDVLGFFMGFDRHAYTAAQHHAYLDWVRIRQTFANR